MKAAKTLSLLLTLTAASVLHGADPYAADTDAPAKIDGYKLVWHDEFDVDGAPNAKDWNFERGFVRNHEVQYYQSSNAVCKGGLLVIEGRKERVKNAHFKDPKITGGNTWKADREFADYTAASLTTAGKRTFRYGRLEVRARIPTAGGAWPAIWTLGEKHDWPSCGEIDLMEYYRDKGGHGEPIILANFCWSSPWGQWTGKWDGARVPFRKFTDRDPDWAKKFHVWRMDWTSERIGLFLDGELINDIAVKDSINEGGWGDHWKGHSPFTQPHYVLVNLALGGDNGGPVDDRALPMRYEIDYVRIYQVGEEPPEKPAVRVLPTSAPRRP